MEHAVRLTFRETGMMLQTLYYQIARRFAVQVCTSWDCPHLTSGID